MRGAVRSFARSRPFVKFLFIGALLCLATTAARSQIRPIDVRRYEWLSVEGERARVIFPDFLLERGVFTASALDFFLDENLATLKPERSWKFPVIINPDMMFPNGFVATHPRRSVFYTMPDQGTVGDWLSHLSVHEGRHMTQLDAMNRHATRALYVLSGENALALWMPTWWLEGDAVMAETVLTNSGRGRDPSFTAEIKAFLLDGPECSYDAMILGSRGRRVPDQYAFGYLMYSHLRSVYDPVAPETLFDQLSRCPLPAIGPDLAMRRVAGMGESAAWRETATYFCEYWKRQVALLDITESTDMLGPTDARYREYPLIAVASDRTIVAHRADLFRGNEIVRVKDGVESVLCAARPINSLSEGSGYIVWDELESHPKFARTSTRIVIRNPLGKRRVVVRSSRLYGPAINRAATEIAACEWREDTASRLVIISPESGEILREYPVPAGEMWGDLSYTDDGKSLVFVSNVVLWPASGNGKRLCVLDVETGAVRVLYVANEENIRHCDARGNAIFFSSDISGIECVYEITADGKVSRVVSRAIGATCPRRSMDGNIVYFVDRFGAKGQTIASAFVTDESRTPIGDVPVARDDFFLKIAETEKTEIPFDPGRAQLVATSAEKWEWNASDVTPISWGPSLAGVWGRGIGLHLALADASGTSMGTVSGGYDYFGDAATACAEYQYRGFRPDISFLAYGSRRDLSDDPYFEYGGWASVSLPLGGGAVGAVQWVITPAVASGVRLRDSFVSVPLKPSLQARVGRGRSEASCQAFWEIDAREVGRGEIAQGSHWLASASLSLPGILSDDALLMTVARENRVSGDSIASGYVRGVGFLDSLRTLSAQATYRVPLLYPDFSVGALVFVNMIRLDAFYDRTYDLDVRAALSVAGAELGFHFMPLRIPFELTAGVRYSWIIESGTPVFQVLLVGIPLLKRQVGAW